MAESEALEWLDERFTKDCQLLRKLREGGCIALADFPEAQARISSLVNSHNCATTAPMFTIKSDYSGPEPEQGTSWRPRLVEQGTSRIEPPDVTDWKPELL